MSHAGIAVAVDTTADAVAVDDRLRLGGAGMAVRGVFRLACARLSRPIRTTITSIVSSLCVHLRYSRE